MKTIQTSIYIITIATIILLVALYPLSWVSLAIVIGTGLLPTLLIRPQLESYNPNKITKMVSIVAQVTVSLLSVFLCVGGIELFITPTTYAAYIGFALLCGMFTTLVLAIISDGLPDNYFKYTLVSVLGVLGILIINAIYYYIDIQIPILENVSVILMWICILIFVSSLTLQFIKDIKKLKDES